MLWWGLLTVRLFLVCGNNMQRFCSSIPMNCPQHQSLLHVITCCTLQLGHLPYSLPPKQMSPLCFVNLLILKHRLSWNRAYRRKSVAFMHLFVAIYFCVRFNPRHTLNVCVCVIFIKASEGSFRCTRAYYLMTYWHTYTVTPLTHWYSQIHSAASHLPQKSDTGAASNITPKICMF